MTAAMHKNWFVVCLFFLFLVSGALLALPGKQAHAGDVLSAVRVLTNKATYGRGERIVVTIHNELTTFLYAPPREPYCSVISVQRLEAEQVGAKGVVHDTSPVRSSFYHRDCSAEPDVGHTGRGSSGSKETRFYCQ